MTSKEISDLSRRCLRAWESADMAQVLAQYTSDAVYSDTLNGRVVGQPGIAKCLGEFFALYDIKFFVTEGHRILGQDGEVVLWECAVRRRMADGRLGEDIVMQRGMSLFMARGDALTRHDAFMDMSVFERLDEAIA